MGELIPLFPLSSPLFPGVVLPLQIFEPRYRRLVTDLVALPEGSDRRFFGVVGIRQGWEVERIAPAEALYDIGCTARLQVVRPESDGGFQIVTVGGDRFRLLDVVVGQDPPYLQAEIDWLADEEAAEESAGEQELLSGPPGSAHPGPGPVRDEVAASVARGSMEVLVRAVRGLFSRYVLEVAGLLTGVAGDPAALSYLVASVSLLTTEDRQTLLAESSTRRRLAAEARMLRRELTILRTVGAVPVPIAQFTTPMTVN